MDRKIRIAQYGCGKMSHYLMRYVLEKGGELVAAFDMNPAMIGTDIGTHLGMEKLGITISDAKDASEILSKEKPDVCIIATRSTMAELKEAFSVCAQNGINAISTCEEALYPWNSSKEITEELDALASQQLYIVRKRIPGYVLGFSDHNSGRIYASHYKNLRKQQL